MSYAKREGELSGGELSGGELSGGNCPTPPYPETSAWTVDRLSLIADCSDGSNCLTIGPGCECYRCIGQALYIYIIL